MHTFLVNLKFRAEARVEVLDFNSTHAKVRYYTSVEGLYTDSKVK